MNLLKMFGLQISLCLLTFRPIASKQLNRLTTLVTLSLLDGAEVTALTHPLWVREVPGSIPGPARIFMFDFVFYCCCVFYFSGVFLSDE